MCYFIEFKIYLWSNVNIRRLSRSSFWEKIFSETGYSVYGHMITRLRDRYEESSSKSVTTNFDYEAYTDVSNDNNSLSCFLEAKKLDVKTLE